VEQKNLKVCCNCWNLEVTIKTHL